ncbi:MAG: ATP-binding cassette domain-containing protein [Bacteroidales bacterium]|nr:ATP-binding cassette domain-containing protein [Bacteroidales bacterium]
MNESLFMYLIHLFAIIVNSETGEISEPALKVIAKFLKVEFSSDQIDQYLIDIGLVKTEKKLKKEKGINQSLSFDNIDKICDSINTEFEQHQKVWIILQLIEFVSDTGYLSLQEFDLIKHIASMLYMPEEEYSNGKKFIIATTPEEIPENPQVIAYYGDSNLQTSNKIHQFKHANLQGVVFFLHIPSTNILLVKYFGDSDIFLNSKILNPGRTYIFGAGGVIRSPRIKPIYFSFIAGTFFQSWSKTNIRITAEEIEYKHKGSKDGIYPFTFDAYSGQFIAIMGGSGVGKSTLINLLNGNLKPYGGRILINGHCLQDNKNSLKKVIGYVPQDDLLVEDLTVYQNLYFGAKFCFSKKSEKEIEELIDETLKDFDLIEARNLKVGNPLNKFISGGQRKRLNIAMELIREPAILFVDEPTSGLSSFDSERIILMLKRQTFKGKVVIANVHQPSSDIYKLFDKIVVMDQGGRAIFQGNPMDAIVYFRHEGQFLKADESECLCCGNVNTEQILRVVESRVVNEYGKLTRKRKRSASEWYELYLKKIQPKILPKSHLDKHSLPANNFSTPNRWQQSKLFFRRNVLSKLANRQFMLIALIEAPLLALLLGFFSKYISGTLNNPNEYIFSLNDNIPSYLFMSVIASLFMGLTISAEEIIRDKKVRQREKFLNLSYFSYINSKVLTLGLFSALQTLFFVAIGSHVLEINGLFFSQWLILFLTALCGNLIGLNISAALNSIVSIYITIPLIIIPMLLLSGVVVNYDKLHYSIRHPEYVPVVGDFNPARWSYEALCVNQFKNNKFNQHFFEFEQDISNNGYYTLLLIPRLQTKIHEASISIYNQKITTVTRNELNLVNKEITRLLEYPYLNQFSEAAANLEFNPTFVSHEEIEEIENFLVDIRQVLQQKQRDAIRKRDSIYVELTQILGSVENVHDLKRHYHNNALEEVMLGRNSIEKIAIYPHRIIRKYNLAHALPTSKIGRAHLFAPSKRIGNTFIDTVWFNALTIFMMTFMLYIALLTNMLRAINQYLERFKFRRLAKRIARYIPK